MQPTRYAADNLLDRHAQGGARAGPWRRRRAEEPVHGAIRARHGAARHQRGHLRLPLHRRRPEGAGPGARARTVVARGARRRQGRVRRACHSSSAASRWAAGWRRTSRPRAATASTDSCFSATRFIRPGKPEQRRDAHLPAITERDALRPGLPRCVRHLEPRSPRCCRRSSTPSCTRSRAAITPSRCQDGRAMSSKESWTSWPRGSR